jgi:hypothetical protein
MYIFLVIYKSKKAYNSWKERSLSSLNNLMTNFTHVQIDNANLVCKEIILNAYKDKLKIFPHYYEMLMKQIFR